MKHKALQLKGRESLYSVKKARKKDSSSLGSIFSLQNYVLTVGFHCVSISSEERSSLLYGILKKLSSSFDIGVLSVPPFHNDSCFIDIYDELKKSSALNAFKGGLEEYLLCSFSSNILIIDATQELLSQPWFGKFEQLLIEYNFHVRTSIITIFHE